MFIFLLELSSSILKKDFFKGGITMKHFICSVQICILTACTFLLTIPQLQAAPADQGSMAKKGSLACPGNHSNQENGNLRLWTAWILRNYDDEQSIQVDNIRVLDAQGTVIKSNPLPFNNVTYTIGPGQTLMFNSRNMGIESINVSTDRPLQFHVDWSAKKKALTLEGTTVLTTLLNDGTTPFGRHAVHCRTISM